MSLSKVVGVVLRYGCSGWVSGWSLDAVCLFGLVYGVVGSVFTAVCAVGVIAM